MISRSIFVSVKMFLQLICMLFSFSLCFVDQGGAGGGGATFVSFTEVSQVDSLELCDTSATIICTLSNCIQY